MLPLSQWNSTTMVVPVSTNPRSPKPSRQPSLSPNDVGGDDEFAFDNGGSPIASSSPPTEPPITDLPTDSPSSSPITSMPTLSPSEMPVTSSPSNSPTKKPTTAAAITPLPTTYPPTISPSTADPSSSPTEAPNTSSPSISPSKEPTTKSP